MNNKQPELLRISCDVNKARELMVLSVEGDIPSPVAYHDDKEHCILYFPRFHNGRKTSRTIHQFLPGGFISE